MKLNVNQDQAKKTLALIPCTTNDPDLLELKQRLERGLDQNAEGQKLDATELDAVLVAVIDELNQPVQHVVDGQNGARRQHRDALKAAYPKLQALRERIGGD